MKAPHRKRLWSIIVISHFFSLPLRMTYADTMELRFESPAGPVQVHAEEIRKRLWVDFSAIARPLGGKIRQSKEGPLWEFSSYKLRFDKNNTTYRVKPNGLKRWNTAELPKRMFYEGEKVMVPMEALPQLCRQSFAYHLQRRILSLDDDNSPTGKDDGKKVAVRTESRDQKQWISIEDTANAIGVVIFSSQANRYRLVLPDLTILELRVGETSVYKHNALYTRLPDPLLLFKGSPYLTLRSLGQIFGIDIQWDAKSKALIIPARYGRLRQISTPVVYRLRTLGYAPQPFHFAFEELSVYYQEPMPLYRADHSDVYESVRDLLTNEPIHAKSTAEDRLNGRTLLDLEGNTFGIPLEARGSAEKIGDTSRVVNASVRWGFPLFQIQGGREYTTFGGLSNQFNLVDQIAVSHSSDHFGDLEKDTIVQARVFHGQLGFAAFLSTAAFSQTIDFDQSYTGGGAEIGWKLPNKQRWGAKVDYYDFQNQPGEVSATYFEQDLLQDILGDDTSVAVSSEEQQALGKTLLTDRHSTTLFNLLYGWEERLEVYGTVGASRFKRPGDGKNINGYDALGRVIIGKQNRRVDISVEEIDTNYRSIGNPLRYKNRTITRIAPTFDILKPWRIFGETRREDIRTLKDQGVAPFRNDFSSLVNLFTFRPCTARTSLIYSDSSLYGRRINNDLNYTQYFGRHSLDLGGGPGSYYNGQGGLFRKTMTGRAGLQLLGRDWKFSFGQEYTRSKYEFYGFSRFDSLSTLLLNVGQFRSFVQYERNPKEYFVGTPLYTGLLRLGHQAGKNKVLNLFYAATSLRSNLSRPEAWRFGLEYTYDF